MPRSHPSARENGLVKNDMILGPLCHSGYVITMHAYRKSAASRPAALGLHITTCWIWLTKYIPCIICIKNTAPKE